MSDSISILIQLSSYIRFAIVPLTAAVFLTIGLCVAEKFPRWPSPVCILGLLGGVAVISCSIWLISSVLEVRYEPTRNMIGFVIMPVIYGATILGVVWLARRKRPRVRHACWILSALAAAGFVVFYFGLITEMPYAYEFTLLRIRGSTSSGGVPILKIIGSDFLYWNTDGYFADDCGDYENLTVVRMDLPNDGNGYYFAYDNRTRVVVPMTEAAAKLYPALMPANDELQDAVKVTGGKGGTTFGNCVLELPAKWFRATIQDRSKQGRRAMAGKSDVVTTDDG